MKREANYDLENEVKTDEWQLYETGKNFNRMQGLYDSTEKNYNFYQGNQWGNAKLGDIQPITQNFIKVVVKFKIGIINANKYQIVFMPNTCDSLQEEQELEEICKQLNKYVNKNWELSQAEIKVRKSVKDSAINSEGIIHLYNEEGTENIEAELIDKTNIYYGDESNPNIQDQPYILLTYRRTVESVREEARKNGVSEEDIMNIVSDDDVYEQSGADKRIEEVSPMCLVITKYYKKADKIYYKKSVKSVVISEEQCTELKYYPIAHMVWEDVKGTARGMGEVEPLIPNQIEVNKTATRRALSVMLTAYPKVVANTKYISDPSALNKVGATIEVDELNAEDVHKVVAYLNPTSMSADASNLQTELITKTQELAGAGDNATGNVDVTQASGKAILAQQEASQQPLNEQLEIFKTYVEDIARIYFDMLCTYQKQITIYRKIKNPIDGKEVEVPSILNKEELEKLKVNIKIEITPNTSYDKYAREEALQGLMESGIITFEEYVDALPEDSKMPKHSLQKILKDREEKQAQIQAIQGQANQLDSAMKQAMAIKENQGNMIENIANQGNDINSQIMAQMGG